MTLWVDRAKRDGHQYSDRPPGTAFAAAPALWVGSRIDPSLLRDSLESKDVVFTPAGPAYLDVYTTRPAKVGVRAIPILAYQGTALAVSIHTVLVGLLGLWAVARLLARRDVDPYGRAFAVGGLGLATLWGPYSTTLFSHVTAGTMIALMLVALDAPARRRGCQAPGAPRRRRGARCRMGRLRRLPRRPARAGHRPGQRRPASRRSSIAVRDPRGAAAPRRHRGVPRRRLRLAAVDRLRPPRQLRLRPRSLRDLLRQSVVRSVDAVGLRARRRHAGPRPRFRCSGSSGSCAPPGDGCSSARFRGRSSWPFHRTPAGGGSEDHRYLVPLLPVLGLGLGALWQALVTQGGTRSRLVGTALILVAAASAFLGWSHFLRIVG